MFEEYNGLVGRETGAENFFMKPLGGFYFDETKFVTAELLNIARSPLTITQHASADISAGSVISPAYGYHIFSAATGMSKASFIMPTASKGAMIYLDGQALVGDANVSVLTNSLVGKVVNYRGSDLSSFEMSAANYVKMTCGVDGTWNIIETYNITEHASS